MAFFSHGEYSFSIDDNLMILEGTGPWNKEAIFKSSDDAVEIHNKLYGKKWGVLAIIHGDPIHTPDAADLLIEMVRNDKNNGRIASALILENSSSPDFGRNHIADIYRKANENFEFFKDVEEAKKWLRAQIKKEQHG